ncbi:YncE family protein [Hymenobacter sp. 15J16-1T3B]|uniref:YncE family protein n=1 Tax=Hymenobacter sp. 15J16-1T3B TaxID=2886941 RepID=UPI001D0F71A4|nr:YncE family protein [Hymenobacter sp. 15J16-1T3B]MCC3160172.1 YncE family protein [Hymenobacter sp. 15J16-1T3B]
MKTLLLLSAFGLGSILPARAQVSTPAAYHLLHTTTVGGEGGWDYLAVDASARRLYLSHATQVEVVDLRTHQKVGTIANTSGVHGILPLPKLGRGYITNGRANTVTIFDLKTLKPLGSLPTGAKPDALLQDDFSGRVFVFNNAGSSATVIDPVTDKVVGTVALGGAPEAGVADGKGRIFVNLEDTNEIVVFDAKTLVVKQRWSVAPGEEPSGLALDRKRHRLFSVCANEKAIVLDAQTGKVVAQVPIGKGVDGVVFDEVTQAAISSNGEGTLTVIYADSPTSYRTETISSARGARTITQDPTTRRLYLSTAEFGPAPAATAEVPHPRPSVVPGTFKVLEFGR